MDQEYPKTRFFWKTEKTQKCLEICQNQRYALWPEFSNPSGSVVSTMFCKVKSALKKNFFLHGDFRPLPNQNVQIWDYFFALLFPKDSESLKILDIRLWEVGAKRRLNGTSKVNTRTNGQTDRRTFRLIESIGPEGQCFEKIKTTNYSIKETSKHRSPT